MAASAAMFEVLGTVEVTVRNALDAELTAMTPGGRWWERARWPAEPARRAHHEPVHAAPLAELHQDALWVLGAVCRVTQDWTARTSRVPALPEQDPRRRACAGEPAAVGA